MPTKKVYVERRDFYPCSLEVLPAEKTDLKARKLSRIQKYARKRCTEYAHIRKPDEKALQKVVGTAVAVLGAVGVGALVGGPVTHAWFFGLKDSAGSSLLIPGALGATAIMAFQGAFGAAWMVRIRQKQQEFKEELKRKRFHEWTRSVLVTDQDLIPALLPQYVEANPYNPDEDAFQYAIGEHYGTEGLKYSNQAFWYGIPFEGLVTGGTLVFGVTGTGKTAAVIRPYMRMVLGWKATTDYDPTGRGMEKVAGLILDPKGDLAKAAQSILRCAGIDPVLEGGRVEDSAMTQLSPLLYAAHIHAGKGSREAHFEARKEVRFRRWIYRQALALGKEFPGMGKAQPGKKMQEWASSGICRLDQERGESGKGKHMMKGKAVYRVERHPNPKRYRGRQEDYIELGFDEFRIQRIIKAYDRIQDARKSMRENLDGNLIKLPSKEVGAKRWASRDTGGAPAAAGEALHDLLGEIERLIAVAFVGSAEHQTAMRGEVTMSQVDLRLVEGIPGTPEGDKDDMEAYADLRQLVRYLAPSKERPGEHVGDYRVRWMVRETTGTIYANSCHAVLERLMGAIRKLEWIGGSQQECRALGGELESFVKLMRMSLYEGLGVNGLQDEQEYGRGHVAMNAHLRDALNRVESYLPPAAIADLQAGHLKAFRIVRGTLPSPRPKTPEEKAQLKNAYSAPDPVVTAVEGATDLYEKESRLAEDLRIWGETVLKEQIPLHAIVVYEMDQMAVRLERAAGYSLAKNPQFMLLRNQLVEQLVMDLLEELPNHLGDAMAAAMMVYPAEVMEPRNGGTVRRDRDHVALALGGCEPERITLNFQEVFQRATLRVCQTDPGHETYLYGAGPLGSILKGRYADETSSVAVGETLGAERENLGFIQGVLASLVDASLNGICQALEQTWGGRPQPGLEEGTLRKRLVELWSEGRDQMRRVIELEQHGAILNLNEDMEHLAQRDRNEAGARNSQVGMTGAPRCGLESLLFFHANPYRRFWGGTQNGRTINLASLSGCDVVWSTVFWKRLLLSLQAASDQMPGWTRLRQVVERVADYHQATVDAFAFYVAPNSGHKVDGPFMFNPIYLPGLDMVNVAATFTKATFAAMNKGGKSDPYWENAGNRLVYNLLNAARILYGYSTFPILARLIGNKEQLRKVMEELEIRRRDRLLKSADLLEVQNILNWYYGEWETPGADKGETKTNVISTLTVVTNAFMAAGYQIAFAPQRQADISFPAWLWVFKHGKVVGVNLPEEKHQGVTPVVLALLNKSFQKYIQLRDSQRSENKEILNPSPRHPRGRLRIQELEVARKVVLDKIQARKLWQEALREWGTDSSGAFPGEMYSDSLMHRILPGRAEGCPDCERVTDTIRTISFRRPVILDVGFAFALGASRDRNQVEESRIRPFLSVAARSAYRTGLLIGRMMTLPALPWSSEFWKGGKPVPMGVVEEAEANPKHPDIQAGRRFLEDADRAVDHLAAHGHRQAQALLDLAGGATVFKRMFRELPMVLVMPKSELFDPAVTKALSGEKAGAEAELRDPRRMHQRDTGSALSLIAKVRDLTREIREVEDEIQMMPSTERYVVWVVDECHFFLEGESDAKYASVARSNRAINLMATQGPSSIYSRMEEVTADALLINFPNMVVMRQSDAEEAETCANLLGGKRRVQVVDRNVTQSFDEMHGSDGEGRGSASGGSVQFTVKEEERWLVEPGILVDLPAFQGVAVTWDGYVPLAPQKVWLKPDFLYTNETLRRYDPKVGIVTDKGVVKLPATYQKGEDLYALPVLRLIELGCLSTKKKEV